MSDWGVTDKGTHSLLETVSNQISGGDDIFYTKSLPRSQLFFGVLTERKLRNQKQGRPGNKAKIITLGDKISRKYYCRNNICKRSTLL